MNAREHEPEILRVPLVEVVLEVRFPGDASVEAVRGAFQECVRDRFPDLRVPKAVPNEAPALMPYVFTDERQSSGVGLALNRLLYSTKEYPGWGPFSEFFLQLWRHLTALVQVPRLTRVGLRYTNRFDVQELGKTFVPDRVPYLKEFFSQAEQFSLQALFRRDAVKLLVQAELDSGAEAVTVAYDAFVLQRESKELEKIIEQLHSAVEEEFSAALSPAYARRLLGTEA